MSDLTISLVIPACQAPYAPDSDHSAWRVPNPESLSNTVDWATTAATTCHCTGVDRKIRIVAPSLDVTADSIMDYPRAVPAPLIQGLRLAQILNARHPDSPLHGHVPFERLTISIPSEFRLAIDAEVRRTAARTGVPVDRINLDAALADVINDGLTGILSTIGPDGSS